MRTVLPAILLACASATLAGEGRPRPHPRVTPLVGAIRWDAWTGGGVTEQVERTLGPGKYHDRLPWFAEVVGENEVRIDGSPQSVMDREIGFAAEAGLDYWAFLLYPRASSMSLALAQYLRSAERERIGFCLILHNTLKADDRQWPAERDRAVALMKERGYLTVLDGRPLVYAFTGSDFPAGRFAELLARARRAGLDPYTVFMGWNPARDFKKASAMGFDAVSAYAKGGGQARFSDLARAVEGDYWRSAARAKVPYVPLVTTGWDKRPRKDTPVSWEKGHGYHRQKVFPSRAEPGEIAAHLDRAIAFVRSHRAMCPADAVIIYAWNEYDEGGWLAPTRGADGSPDASRLDAIRRVLEKRDEATRPAGAGD
ncbi:MAG: glycoside hydrolase family 71/99 protein [Planctomycetota bacterium]